MWNLSGAPFQCNGDARTCHARRRCSVYRTSLGGHSLLVSAEIDCEEALADGARAFVEIKTSGSMQTPESRCNFRERKLIKYWIQSYVAGVPTIVVGYRSEDGVLTVRPSPPPPPPLPACPPPVTIVSLPMMLLPLLPLFRSGILLRLAAQSPFALPPSAHLNLHRESIALTLWKYRLTYQPQSGTATNVCSLRTRCSRLSGSTRSRACATPSPTTVTR
jgi:hypothetical protein